MKIKFLAAMCAILLLTVAFVASVNAEGTLFTDVKEGEYYYDATYYMYNHGVTNGTSDTTFGPNEACTRGQTVTFLWRLAGKPEPSSTENPFLDISQNAYYYKAVIEGVEKGTPVGTSETTFSPDDIVTRAEFVTFLWRHAGKFQSSLYSIFDDAKDNTQFYYYPILWAYSWNITNGVDANNFGVNEPCTRGQTVTFLYRYCNACMKTEKSDSTTYKITSLTLNGEDISKFVICYDTSSNGLMKFAAEELQEYIKTSTGVELTIHEGNVAAGTKRIYIKDEIVEDDTDGYKYYTDSNGLVLQGSQVRGALYSVYNFLEDELGWRFFAYDSEVLLTEGPVALKNLNVTYKQYFALRTVFWSCYLSPECKDISAKTMCNGDSHGLEDYRGGSVSFNINGVHSLGSLSETGDGVSENPCLNSEQIYQTVLKNVKKILANHPDAIVSVAQNDTEARCKCALCQADDTYYGSPAGSIIKFCNKLADEVNLTYPNAKIQTLAYAYSRTCPKNITVNDNVYVQLCSSDCCLNHPLRDTNCPLNAPFANDLVGWGKICNHIQIWDYTIDFPFYLCPVPNLDLLLDNLRFFHENNVYAVFEQGNFQEKSPGFGELRGYLLTKCFENPYMTDEEYYAYMDEFLKYYYGDGWIYIREYIDTIQKMADDLNSHFKFAAKPEEIYGSHPFRENNELFIKLFDKAEELANNDSQLWHVRSTRISCDFIRIGSIFNDYYKATDDRDQKREYIYAAIETLFKEIQEFDIHRLGENVPMPAAIASYKLNPRRWGNYYGNFVYDENE